MEQSTALSKAENNALQVSYEVLGTRVELDIEFVKKYLVRGRSDLTSNQELVFFMNTCKMQRLNPLANGEVYLIKYSKDDPAQMVIGKDAYLKRAFCNPNYMGKKDGIVVQRGTQIVMKEGCCLYPTETLIGGWCRVFYTKNGINLEAYREVAFSEYNKGMSNWKSKPATMINKVAISQCVRDAFPSDYEGLYSEDELIASGAISPQMQGTGQVGGQEIIIGEDNVDGDGVVMDMDDSKEPITQEERKALFALAKELFGSEGNDILKDILADMKIESTQNMTKGDLKKVEEALKEEKNDRDEAMHQDAEANAD